MEKDLVKLSVERNELQLKEMLDSMKNVISHFVVDRASTRMIIRRIGYNGVTVCFSYFKPNGTWSIESGATTPDGIQFMINNFGKQLEDDHEFYKASKAYSVQEHGAI